MDQTEVSYRAGFDYGMGVRSASGAPLAPGVVGAATQVKDASGGDGTWQLSRINSNEDLERSLGISADASGGVGLFSASAKFNFSSNMKVQSSSLILIVKKTMTKGFEQIYAPALSPDAAALVAAGKLDQFLERYGDTFVRGIYAGGEFFGVFRIDTRSEQSRQSVEASMHGAYGAFSANVGFNLTDTCAKENASVYCNAIWSGGRVTANPTTADGLFDALRQWDASVDAAPKPFVVTLAPYVVALGPEPPNKEDLQHQRDVLKQCARLRSQTLDKLNLVEFIVDPVNAPQFEAQPGGPDLAILHAGLSADLQLIAEAASHALDNPKDAVDPETFARVNKQQLDYNLTLIPANIPKHSGATVIVPNFNGVDSESAASLLAAANRLTLHWIDDDQRSDAFQVVKQDFAPGTPVSPATTVTLTTHLTPQMLRSRRLLTATLQTSRRFLEAVPGPAG